MNKPVHLGLSVLELIKKLMYEFWYDHAERNWKMLENTGILNLSQQKEEELFGVRTKLLYNKGFHRKFISNRNEKTEILMNKPVHLGLSILELI